MELGSVTLKINNQHTPARGRHSSPESLSGPCRCSDYVTTKPPVTKSPRHRGPRGRGPGRKAQIEPRLSRVGRTVGRSDIIHLNNFLGPVDDTVTAQLQSQSHKVTSSQATRSSSGRASRPSYSKVQLSPAHFDIFGLYLCHTSSVRSTSDSSGPVTRKSSG